MPATNLIASDGQMPVDQRKTGPLNVRKLIAAAGIAGALIFTSACSASEAAAPAGTAFPAASASASATPSATPSPTATFPYTLSSGLIAKGIANDGHGDYIQTSIADTDPAMQYNPAITDDASKAHFSEAELADAQKFIVRFIAEEAIDSTLNGGTEVDGWWAAHKDQIHPSNQGIMLKDMKADTGDKAVIAREMWMATKPGFSYVHGTTTPRVTQRTITPTKISYVEGNGLQGVWLATRLSYSMAVSTDGTRKPDQHSTAELSYAVAKDSADGKWKIAAYQADFHTAELLR